MVEVDDGLWTEQRMADQLDVSRNRLRQLRGENLEEGRDWTLVRQAVTYTQEGVERMTLLVRTAVTPVKKKNEEGRAAWMDPPERHWRPFTREETTVVVVHRITPNTHVLMGKLEDGRLVRVRVKPSPFWCPGMRLPSVKLGVEYFEFRGRRPRAWRRW